MKDDRRAMIESQLLQIFTTLKNAISQGPMLVLLRRSLGLLNFARPIPYLRISVSRRFAQNSPGSHKVLCSRNLPGSDGFFDLASITTLRICETMPVRLVPVPRAIAQDASVQRVIPFIGPRLSECTSTVIICTSLLRNRGSPDSISHGV